MTLEQKNRLEERLNKFRSAETPEEISFLIWSEQLEEATGSSKQSYRDGLVEWIKAYKEERLPKLYSKYKTPLDLAEGVWPPYLDDGDNDVWFISLRKVLVNWINNYKQKKSGYIVGVVNNFERKNQLGFTRQEIDQLIEEKFPDINMDKFNNSLEGCTCGIVDDVEVIYVIDVITAINCGIDNREINDKEFD